MNTLNTILLPDEEIVFQTKKHFIIFILPILLTCFALFFFLNSNPYVVKMAFLPAIAALFSAANQALLYMTSEFVITTKRIIMREGFFFKHTNNTRLATIANVSVNQSLVGQMLNYGTVILHAFGGDADPFMEIARPNEFQKNLQMQLDKVVKQ